MNKKKKNLKTNQNQNPHKKVREDEKGRPSIASGAENWRFTCDTRDTA